MSEIQKLNQIRQGLQSYDYVDLTFMLNTLLPRIPINATDFKMQNDDRTQNNLDFKILYRARPHKNNLDKKGFESLSEISYIKKEDSHLIKDFGRVNKPGESMFYCSTAIEVACLEGISKGLTLEKLNKDWEYWLTVGMWKLKSDLKLAEINKSLQCLENLMKFAPNLKIPERDLECAKICNEKIRNLINDDHQFDILNFFSDEFAKTKIVTPKEYMLSNYYADRVLNKMDGFKSPPLDGILYPSIPSGYNYNNLVLEPEIVESKLEFIGATKVRVLFPMGKEIIFEVMHGGLGVKADENGILQWHPSSQKLN